MADDRKGHLAVFLDQSCRGPILTATLLSQNDTLIIKVRRSWRCIHPMRLGDRLNVYDAICPSAPVFPSRGNQNSTALADMKVCYLKTLPVDVVPGATLTKSEAPTLVRDVGCRVLTTEAALARARCDICQREISFKFES
jgi:hypothetical protein